MMELRIIIIKKARTLRKLISKLIFSDSLVTPRQAKFRLVRDFVGLLLIALGLIYALYAIVDNQRNQIIEGEKRRAYEQMSAIRASIEQRIQANVLVLRALKPEILWQDTPDRERLQRMIDEFMDLELDISHLALAPDLVVSYVYPEEKNVGALGLDYRTVTGQYHEVLLAIASQDIMLAGPVNLVQGGVALIARLPIFDEQDKLWGIVSLVIDHQAMFDKIGLHRYPEYQVVLTRQSADSKQTTLISGKQQLLTDDYISMPINVPGDTWQITLAPRDGQWLPADRDFTWLWFVGGGVIALIVMAFSILIVTQSRLRRAFYTISYQSRFDPLTDLPNRQFFNHKLLQCIENAEINNNGFAILLLDLDHLRDINDALGHEIGDALLKKVVERLAAMLPPEDILGRIGGDEFAIISQQSIDSVEVETMARRFLSEIMNTTEIAHNQINITASMGIALFPRDATEAQALIKCAELALYAAKSTGSMSVSFFDEHLRQATEQHIALHHQMITALDTQQFHVEYQPVIDTQSGLLSRCEALIRWDHPTRGAISPAEFIPIAEKTGAIIWLGEYVLQQVIKDWQKMRDNGLALTIAVNRSPREFNDKDAADNWLAALEQAGMPADCLMLEITESMLMRNKERQLDNLKKLRSAGVHLAIDDFGTGYSSLNYLRSYPIDVIKIDRGFLANVPVNPTQTALVEVLLRIAFTLNMQVIAEGVEERSQVEFLRDKGCHFQQGFFYGRSMRLDAFMKFAHLHNEQVRLSATPANKE